MLANADSKWRAPGLPKLWHSRSNLALLMTRVKRSRIGPLPIEDFRNEARLNKWRLRLGYGRNGGKPRSMVFSSRILAKIYLEQRKRTHAVAALRRCREMVKAEFLSLLGEDLLQLLGEGLMSRKSDQVSAKKFQ